VEKVTNLWVKIWWWYYPTTSSDGWGTWRNSVDIQQSGHIPKIRTRGQKWKKCQDDALEKLRYGTIPERDELVGRGGETASGLKTISGLFCNLICILLL